MSDRQIRVQLYLCTSQRKYVLDMNERYISRFRDQFLPLLDDASEQADKARDEFIVLASPACYDEDDYFSIHEDAISHGMKIYEDTLFMRHQLIGLSLSGLYHLWERHIKRFINAEVMKDGARPTKPLAAWNFKDVVETLATFGFDVRNTPIYDQLNRLRLVSNAVKHGDGPARTELKTIYPELFSRSYGRTSSLIGFERDEPEFQVHHFDQLSSSIIDFWNIFPERLVLDVP